MVIQEKVLRKIHEEIEFAFIDDTMESFTHRFLKRQKELKIGSVGTQVTDKTLPTFESTLNKTEAILYNKRPETSRPK